MSRFFNLALFFLVLTAFPLATVGQVVSTQSSEFPEVSPLRLQGESEKPGLPGSFGIRAGIGTDVQLGLGIGIGASYAWFPKTTGMGLEIGADLFYHKSKEEDSDEDYYATYDEETELTIFAVRANGLFNYYPSEGRAFFIAGFGFLAASVYWEETQKPKDQPGTSRPYDDAEGTSAGNIVNLGVGYAFKNGLEFRVETPLLYFYNTSGGASSFAPTITATIQYRFQ